MNRSAYIFQLSSYSWITDGNNDALFQTPKGILHNLTCHNHEHWRKISVLLTSPWVFWVPQSVQHTLSGLGCCPCSRGDHSGLHCRRALSSSSKRANHRGTSAAGFPNNLRFGSGTKGMVKERGSKGAGRNQKSWVSASMIPYSEF